LLSYCACRCPCAARARFLTLRQRAASDSASNQAPGSHPPTLDDTLEAGDDEAGQPAFNLVTWNEFDLKFTTFRFGAGFLYDFAAFAQDAASKKQIGVQPTRKSGMTVCYSEAVSKPIEI
jgi:hypothetical protein